MTITILIVASVSFSIVVGSPLQRRASITSLTAAQIASYKPYSYFAAAAWCSPSTTLTWTCGANCNANPGFKTVASGGDGATVQYWFVGYDPTLQIVIVSHQGTDTSKILPILEDVDVIQENLHPTLFPGVSSSVQVHSGFAGAQARTATSVLAAVNIALTRYSASHVTVVGHSLGAAIALIDSVYLLLHLPSVTFSTIVYGLPRVGNQAFANYVDSHLHLTHINNKKDPVPIVPGRFLGYVHPSGEVHIQGSSAWAACPGQDNPSILCIVGDVPNIFVGKPEDHDGPYDGVMIRC